MHCTLYLAVALLLVTAAGANLHQLKNLIKREGREQHHLRNSRHPSFGDDEDYGSSSGSGSDKEELECGPNSTGEELERYCGGPCGKAHCQDYPEAECRVNGCEDCETEWYVQGSKITQHDCTNRPTTCPGVWIPKGDSCYRVQNRYSLNMKKAQKYCMRQGGHLLAIESSAEQSLIQTLPLNLKQNYWTAGIADSQRNWYWQLPHESKPFSYTKWASSEPNDRGYEGYTENRVILKLRGSYSGWTWNDVDGHGKAYSICEAAPDKVQTHCDSKPCMNGGECVMVADDTYRCDCGPTFAGTYCEFVVDNSQWHRFGDHLYLAISDFGLSQNDATNYCGVHDAYLVSINDQAEWQFIKNMLDKKGWNNPTKRFLTGGYMTPTVSSSAFAWADGTTLGSFSDWGPGQPSSSTEPYIQVKYYTESSPSIHGWRWNDAPGNWVNGFICEKTSYAPLRRQVQPQHHILKRMFIHRWNHVDATRKY